MIVYIDVYMHVHTRTMYMYMHIMYVVVGAIVALSLSGTHQVYIPNFLQHDCGSEIMEFIPHSTHRGLPLNSQLIVVVKGYFSLYTCMHSWQCWWFPSAAACFSEKLNFLKRFVVELP